MTPNKTYRISNVVLLSSGHGVFINAGGFTSFTSVVNFSHAHFPFNNEAGINHDN